MPEIKLRPYQEEAINRTLSRFKTHRSALVVLAVGLGKSWVMTNVAKEFKRVVFLQPCLELVDQNHSKLVGSGLNSTMISSGHKTRNWSADYIYTTPQTLCKNLDRLDEPDLVIIDESNCFYEGTMFNTIFSRWKKCKIMALTATPYYYRRKAVYRSGWVWSQTTIVSIEEFFGPAVINIDRDEGYALGYSPKIEIKKADIQYCNADHINNQIFYKNIVDKHIVGVNNLLKTLRNGIIFCDSIKHAALLSETFNIPTVFGSTPKKRRADLIKRFNQGRIPFLLTVGCLVRGYDRQDLENIVLLSNFKNACEFEQVLGRLNRGTCSKTCWYNGVINTTKPEPGKVELVRIKRIGQ